MSNRASPPTPLPVGEGRRLTNYGKRKEPARKLRNSQTDAEKKLWLRLRDRRLGGFKFRRQVPIGPFFVDFCCADKNLIVEIDGGQHRTAKDDDANRSIYLNEQGFRVLRFWNYDVLKKINTICKQILVELKKPEY